ncbi:MAG: LamG domain-containing protein [Okeania sp. SIO2C2]|uniref:LamG domain-containing protein n=1 Tax=Okeania sp. SIO2C2 TaxID=2607787 RepID=UPI0013BDA77A|nr:LamG domain-containing protein [Okeania sp. SIO2C2]NEP86274.1 LamG domain-containing protein [Okeania sp. SIO2C2]
MSNDDGSLQLYLKLDEIKDGKVIDTSGNERNSTVHGNPQVVDDEFMGKCLQLEGKEDGIDLHNKAIPVGAEITLSFWANGGDSLPNYSTVICTKDSENNLLRTLTIYLPGIDYMVYFECGDNAENASNIIFKQASPSDVKGQWSYWTFTKDANKGEMKIYLNGQLWHSEMGKTLPIPEVEIVQLGIFAEIPEGAEEEDKGSYQGKLAHFRIYSRALSQQEIKRDLALSIAPELEEELNELRNIKKTKEGEQYDNWPEISKHFGLSTPE